MLTSKELRKGNCKESKDTFPRVSRSGFASWAHEAIFTVFTLVMIKEAN